MANKIQKNITTKQDATEKTKTKTKTEQAPVAPKMSLGNMQALIKSNYPSVKKVNPKLADEIFKFFDDKKLDRTSDDYLSKVASILDKMKTALGGKLVSAPNPAEALQKKSSPKDDKKQSPIPEDAPSAKSIQLAKMFPQTLTIDGSTYEVDHTVKTMSDLQNGEFEFAFYWTARHLRQFPYFGDVLGHPKSFPNDLDTAQLIYVSDAGKVAYCVSDATEGVYSIMPGDLIEEDGLRIASGIEYQIYKKKDETTSPAPKAETPAETKKTEPEEKPATTSKTSVKKSPAPKAENSIKPVTKTKAEKPTTKTEDKKTSTTKKTTK